MRNFKLYCYNAIYEVDETGKIIKIIPKSDDNYDYQYYLKWIEDGNTPIPADAVIV